MKRTVKLIALLCALLMIVSLAACGSKTEEKASSDKAESGAAEVTEAASNLTDFEWVKFEVPEGFEDTQESDSYVAFKDKEDTYRGFHVSWKSVSPSKTLEEIAESDTQYSTNASVDAAVELGGRTWVPVHFDFNDEPSVYLFTQIDEKHCCYIVAYKMTENDAAVQTIVNSIEFVPENL